MSYFKHVRHTDMPTFIDGQLHKDTLGHVRHSGDIIFVRHRASRTKTCTSD